MPSIYLRSIYVSSLGVYNYIRAPINLNSFQQILGGLPKLRNVLILFWTLNTFQPFPNPMELDVGSTQRLSSASLVITAVHVTATSLLYGEPGYHQLSRLLGGLPPLFSVFTQWHLCVGLFGRLDCARLLHKIQLCSCPLVPLRSRAHSSLTLSRSCQESLCDNHPSSLITLPKLFWFFPHWHPP